MKNKYQKALNIVKSACIYDWMDNKEHVFMKDDENIKTLQELVDRATPKKPIREEGIPKCPNCKGYSKIIDGWGDYHNNCGDCGQALDWSK